MNLKSIGGRSSRVTNTHSLDREWLESVNADRRKEQLDKVSYEVFEIVMDKLEKEWFDLVRDNAGKQGPFAVLT